MKKLLIIVFLVLVLSACAPSPQDGAEATAIVLEASAKATQTAQQTAQKQVEWQLTQKEREAIQEQVILAWRIAVFCLLIAGSYALYGLAKGLHQAFVGAGKAAEFAAMTRAGLIYLDKDTFQFPLYHNNAGMLTNANDNSVMDTTKPQIADRQKLLLSGDVQRDGVITRGIKPQIQPQLMGLDLRKRGHERVQITDDVEVMTDDRY
jgi:hypothetical protein